MKTLPARFHSNGFAFEQIDRQGDIALFRKTKGNFETFEVVRIQHTPEGPTPWGYSEGGERMPASEQWGTHGWSLQTRQRAFEKFGELQSDG